MECKGLWIPKRVLADKRLTSSEKIVLAEIIALASKGKCSASNQHLADITALSRIQLRKIIYKLKENGYISVSLHRAGDTQQVIGRDIHPMFLEEHTLCS